MLCTVSFNLQCCCFARAIVWCRRVPAEFELDKANGIGVVCGRACLWGYRMAMFVGYVAFPGGREVDGRNECGRGGVIVEEDEEEEE